VNFDALFANICEAQRREQRISDHSAYAQNSRDGDVQHPVSRYSRSQTDALFGVGFITHLNPIFPQLVAFVVILGSSATSGLGPVQSALFHTRLPDV
jgi:hypothetical protein